MVLRIIEFIGKEVLRANPYIDVFGANCITTRDGRIVNFIGAEKQDFGVSDIKGIGSYARIEPTIEYTDITNTKTSSCKKTTRGSISFRLVVFQVNAVTDILNPAKLENKIWGDLQAINFKDYVGNESQIDLSIESSNLDFSENFKKEIGKDYEIGADSIIIALNCKLSWIVASDNCEVCSVTGISSLCVDGVNIVNQDGNVIAVIECGKSYNVGSIVPSSRKLTINGTTYDLSQDRTWNISVGSSQTLAQTLGYGNSTSGNRIVVDDGDVIQLGTSSFTPGLLGYDGINSRSTFIHGGTGDFFALKDSGGVLIKGPTGAISSDGIGNAIQLDWDESGNQMQFFNLNGQIGVYTAKSYVFHDTMIEFDSPNIRYTNESASTLPYFDSSKYLKSSTIGADGNNLLFASSYGVDAKATAGTDVLNIGATNANVINYGNASTTHNFLGTAIYELQVNSYVTDKLITLNYGGSAASGIGVGFEIEENSVIVGYIKTNADRSGYSLLTPAIAYKADISLASLTADRIFTLPDLTGTFALTANKLSVFASTTSAELAVVISNETGSASGGVLVFNNAPTLINPIISNSGASNTAGALGYDGLIFYGTPNSRNPGVIPTIQYMRQDSSRVLANSGSVQKLFNSGASGNGAFNNVQPGWYLIECMVQITLMNATSGNGAFSLAGTASTGTFNAQSIGVDGSPLSTAGNRTGCFTITNAFANPMQSAGVSTQHGFYIVGTFEVTSAGTVIPSYQLNTAIGTATIAAGSYCTLRCLGANNATYQGNVD